MFDLILYAVALAAGVYCMWRGHELAGFRGKHIENIKAVTKSPEAAREFAQKQGFVVRGMGLLDCKTVFTPDKTRTRKTACCLGGLLEGAQLAGYEIHQGRTVVNGQPFIRFENGEMDGCISGSCAGTYLHGLFDTDSALETLAQKLCDAKGIEPAAPAMPQKEWRQSQYDKLADGVRSALDMKLVYDILEGRV